MADNYQQLVAQHGSPLMVLDCDVLRQQYEALSAALPDVALFYAIKALPNASVVNTFNQLGAHFEASSLGELALLRSQYINPRTAIYTHPIKSDVDIRSALRFGCTTFVVDNVLEVEKFIAYRHRVGLLIRVNFHSDDARINLAKKFGCTPEEALLLIQRAQYLGLCVKGLSFHVGSQTLKPDAYVDAISASNEIIAAAYDKGLTLNMLDIGGGFPVRFNDSVPLISEFCQPINKALKALPEHVGVVAEPGRFLAAPCMTNICEVVGKDYRNGCFWYYLNDGVYGSYSGKLFDHGDYPITTVKQSDEKFESVLAGPTCDSIDIIAENILLPELNIGDLVIGHVMGAYTIASSTNFNSLPTPKVLVLNEKKADRRVAYIQSA